MYGINGAATRDKTTLIGGQLDDVADITVHNSLKDFHAVREQANWAIASAVSRTALLFPDRDRRALLPALRHLLLCDDLVEEVRQPPCRIPAFRFPQVRC